MGNNKNISMDQQLNNIRSIVDQLGNNEINNKSLRSAIEHLQQGLEHDPASFRGFEKKWDELNNADKREIIKQQLFEFKDALKDVARDAAISNAIGVKSDQAQQEIKRANQCVQQVEQILSSNSRLQKLTSRVKNAANFAKFMGKSIVQNPRLLAKPSQLVKQARSLQNQQDSLGL